MGVTWQRVSRRVRPIEEPFSVPGLAPRCSRQPPASPTRTAKERSALPQDEQSEATEIGERVGRRSTVECARRPRRWHQARPAATNETRKDGSETPPLDPAFAWIRSRSRGPANSTELALPARRTVEAEFRPSVVVLGVVDPHRTPATSEPLRPPAGAGAHEGVSVAPSVHQAASRLLPRATFTSVPRRCCSG